MAISGTSIWLPDVFCLGPWLHRGLSTDQVCKLCSRLQLKAECAFQPLLTPTSISYLVVYCFLIYSLALLLSNIVSRTLCTMDGISVAASVLCYRYS